MKSPLKLLICEDQESDAFMIIRQLERAGNTVLYQRVDTATDMKAALREPWDIIISDFYIPGFGGVEALRLLNESGLDIPFILVSGTIGEEVAVNVMKSGASDYLMKDRLERLGEAVKREMEEVESRKKRKIVADQIRANEEKYRAVVDCSLLGILLGRPNGQILEANEAASNLFGYSQEELCQLRREQLFDFTDPLLTQKIKERNQKGNSSGEFIGIKKNGERFHCEISSAVFKDIAGNKMSCTMLSDISARKNAEQKLRNSNEELKQLSHHLKNARENERKHIAREIHDELGQLASAIKIELDWLNINLQQQDGKLKPRIERGLFAVTHMIDSTRKIASSLRPSILDDSGLNASLKWQCTEFQELNGISCLFTEDHMDSDMDLEIRTELFRICQEALTNVMRHAHASEVAVNIRDKGDQTELSITDNGKGFDTKRKSSHLGLVGIRERAYSVNGELFIESNPGSGTTIRVIVPKNNNKEKNYGHHQISTY